jgi:hypothetical protein
LSRLRNALSFENVVVTVVAFAVLAGGTAYAASHLGRNSVGSKQLKANSVTAKKIKKNAVTAAKIKKNAVTGAKVKDGAVGAAALNPASNPFAGIVHSSGTATVTIASSPTDPVSIPLTSPAYTQPAGETDFAAASVRLSFAEGCAGGAKRLVFLGLFYDQANPGLFESGDGQIASGGLFDSLGGGPDSLTASFSSFGTGLMPAPSAATNRTLSLVIYPACENPGTVTVSDGNIDLIGVK